MICQLIIGSSTYIIVLVGGMKKDHINQKRAFIDTNVLAHIVGGSSRGKNILSILNREEFEAFTFSKCKYELYSQ